VTITMGRQPLRGITRDISRQGVRMQFLDEITLKKGDDVKFKLHPDENSDTVLAELTAHVVWSERVGKIRPVWNLGMTFVNLGPDDLERLGPLLQD
jgi:PilZ domain